MEMAADTAHKLFRDFLLVESSIYLEDLTQLPFFSPGGGKRFWG